jgi:DNA modification methylase
MVQDKLVNEKDEFVESLHLTPEKIREDLEKMRDVKGFPIGDIEDILELSSPPYYTAYPNPYIKDFIEFYGTPYDEETDDYDVEPFVGDVSEGKNDSVYNAHSYHTKVPHKAIMKYIEHYTKPGDIVFDGFCGSGMTGVAAQILNRKVILSDLSTAATFIAYNYNKFTDSDKFIKEAEYLVKTVENEYGELYRTNHIHSDGNIEKGIVHYTIWSDLYLCPFCKSEHIFWKEAVDKENKRVLSEYNCPNCDSKINKKICKVVDEKIYDSVIGQHIILTKKVPVLINYSIKKGRFEKEPDADDLKLINNINSMEIPYWYPFNEIPDGYNTKQPKKSQGFSHLYHFYTKRNLLVLSSLFNKCNTDMLKFDFLNTSWHGTLMRRYNPRGGHRPLTGTLYVPQLSSEANMLEVFDHKVKMLKKFLEARKIKNFLHRLSAQSTTDLSNLTSNSVDYIFTDPPFGSNIMYSELNLIWESWLKVFTNNKTEAIINQFQNKGNFEYNDLMTKSFQEMFRILKPNRWITVEFHNSKAEIWRIIQESIVKAGFIIAQVAVLDKKQGSFKQLTSPGSVKNDLVINAYKPFESFSESFFKKTGLNMEKDFIEMHLHKLPSEPNIERTEQMLYSKLLAQYIQNGFEVRMDASEFYEILRDNFEERDGYWFNEDQIEEYEKKTSLKNRLGDEDFNQTILGISDEKSTIIWLAQFLQFPKTYDEIFIDFSKNLLTSTDKIPELKIILEENFTTEGGKYKLPSDLERKGKEEVRDKRLIKEFNEILEETLKSKRKIKEVRKEALLHGLMKLYKEKDIDQIKLLGNRLDRKIIDSDDDISAIVDWAMYK